MDLLHCSNSMEGVPKADIGHEEVHYGPTLMKEVVIDEAPGVEYVAKGPIMDHMHRNVIAESCAKALWRWRVMQSMHGRRHPNSEYGGRCYHGYVQGNPYMFARVWRDVAGLGERFVELPASEELVQFWRNQRSPYYDIWGVRGFEGDHRECRYARARLWCRFTFKSCLETDDLVKDAEFLTFCSEKLFEREGVVVVSIEALSVHTD